MYSSTSLCVASSNTLMAESAVHWNPIHLQLDTTTFASLEATEAFRQKFNSEREKYNNLGMPLTALGVIRQSIYQHELIASEKVDNYTLNGYFGTNKGKIANGMLEVRGLAVNVDDIVRLLAMLLDETGSDANARRFLLSPALTDLFFGILESPKRRKIAYLPMAVFGDARFTAAGDGILSLRQHLLLGHINDMTSYADADKQLPARLRNAAIGAIGVLDMVRVETRKYLYATYFETMRKGVTNEMMFAPPLAHADGFLSPFWADHRDVIRVESKWLEDIINPSAPTVIFFFLPSPPDETFGDPNVLVWIIKPISGQLVVFYWSYAVPFSHDDKYENRDYLVRKRIEKAVGSLDNLAILGDLTGTPSTSNGAETDTVNGKYVLVDGMLPFLEKAKHERKDDDDALMQYHSKLSNINNRCILLHMIAQELCKTHNIFCNLDANNNRQINLGSMVTDYVRDVIHESTSLIMKILLYDNPKEFYNSLATYIAPLSTVL